MAAFPKPFALLWLMVILMNVMVAVNVVAASTSMIAHLDHKSAGDLADLDTDLRRLLRLKGKTAMEPFEKVLSRFTDVNQNKCDVETQFRFAAACKEFEGKSLDDVGNTQALEGIKSLYAIRKAICETASSGTAVLPACVVLMPNLAPHASRKTILEADLESAVSSNIPACLKEFQRQHYYWTSYSNNLQDATAVFNMLRSDVELRNIIVAYQDFAASLHGLQDEMDHMSGEVSQWYFNISLKAQEVLDQQDRVFSGFNAGFKNASTTVFEHLYFIQSALRVEGLTMENFLSDTKHSLVDLKEGAVNMTANLVQAMNELAAMHDGTATDLAAFYQTQEHGVMEILKPFERVLPALANALRGLGTNVDTITEHVHDVIQVQVQQLSIAREQVDVADAVLSKQIESGELVNETHTTMQRIFKSAEDLEGRVQTFASILAYVEHRWDIVDAVITYSLFSFGLRPFEAIDGLRDAASVFKTAYCAFRAARFLWLEFDMKSQIQSIVCLIRDIPALLSTQAQDWWPIAACISCSLTVILSYVIMPAYEGEENLDLEKAESSPHGSMTYMSSSQLKRMESVPRGARHGTAPPGL